MEHTAREDIPRIPITNMGFLQALMEPPIHKHNPEPPSEERLKLKRVMVYGINKSHQVNEIKKEYEGKLDLRFGHTDDPTAMMRQQMANMDMVFVLTDHINHRTRFAVEQTGVPMELIKGHISALKDKLWKFYRSERETDDSTEGKGRTGT